MMITIYEKVTVSHEQNRKENIMPQTQSKHCSDHETHFTMRQRYNA